MAKSAAASAGGKCSCSWGFMILSWILFTLALWLLVGGFATQFQSSSPTSFSTTVAVWYFVGIVVLGLGKMCKWKAHGNCPVHKMG